MELDKDRLQEICGKIDLVDYVSQTHDLTKRADLFFCHCTKHLDKTASLAIYPDQNSFYCYSCHRGGNIISWLINYEGLSYNNAIDKVGQLAGVDIHQLKQCSSLKYFRQIKRCADKKLNIQPRIYLNEHDIEQFRKPEYGVEPLEWLEEGIQPDIMEEFNIRIDDNANRIVYPQRDANGKLIGFKGRTRYKSYKEMGIPKYVSYNKIGTVDFFQGLYENEPYILTQNQMIVFEGLKSVLKAGGWGCRNCVSAETSSLNDAQIELIVNLGVRECIIGFDSDVSLNLIKNKLNKLTRFTNVFVIYDWKHQLLNKMAPVDKGREVFEDLLNSRIKI